MRFKGDCNDNSILTGRNKNKIENEIKSENVEIMKGILIKLLELLPLTKNGSLCAPKVESWKDLHLLISSTMQEV